jgi:hypothetical protein
MAKQLLFIVGSAYSGSSILSYLMDQIKGVVSMGEGARAYSPGSMPGPCATCGVKNVREECELFKRWEPTLPAVDKTVSIYDFMAEEYEDEHVIVDSTKDPTTMVAQKQTGKDYPTKVVFLSKSPVEAFNSYFRHPRFMTPHDCVVEWLRVNYYYYGFLQINGLETLHVTYENLSKDQHRTLNSICKFLGITYEYRAGIDTPLGHILGGNPSVSSLVSGDDDLCFANSTRNSYMAGKYAKSTTGEVDKTIEVAYDTSHRDMDAVFKMECQYELDKHAHKVGPLLQLLGHPTQKMRLFE